MKRSRRGSFRALPLVMLILLAPGSLSGCGTTVSGDAVAAEIDIRSLDIGSFAIEPLDYRATYSHRFDNGATLAIMRLADSVANGWEIDPGLKYSRHAKPLTESSQIGDVLADVDVPIVEREHMLFGFAMSATSTGPAAKDYTLQHDVNSKDDQPQPDTIALNLTVLQFPDADAAGRAAADVEAADFAVAADANSAVVIDGFPKARAHWRPGVPTLGATMARGSYLVNVFVKRPDADLGKLKELTGKALATEIPLLDALPPLSKREVAHLDYDPQAMLRRALHPEDLIWPSFTKEFVFTPRGFMHLVADSETWRHSVEVGGIDLMAGAPNGGLVMRARDSAAAAALLREIKDRIQHPADSPVGVPDAYCSETAAANLSRADERFYCTVRYGRYLGRVHSAQLQDARQRAAAQFALLVNSSWM
ncbi:hypothetical protein ACFVUS_16665 [Nocardia sp. NPDC058058]|uniref:DUF7373 family lipoprotein n=1 Tax=Nocardia sp. NPDC058058 TaxID=3346317 RepID=UPI0036DCBE0A